MYYYVLTLLSRISHCTTLFHSALLRCGTVHCYASLLLTHVAYTLRLQLRVAQAPVCISNRHSPGFGPKLRIREPCQLFHWNSYPTSTSCVTTSPTLRHPLPANRPRRPNRFPHMVTLPRYESHTFNCEDCRIYRHNVDFTASAKDSGITRTGLSLYTSSCK